MNRRDSLHRLVLGGTVLFLSPSILQSCTKDNSDPGRTPGPGPGSGIEIDLSLPENAALNNTGGSKIVQAILVANTGNGYIALSSICTHQGCTVAYNGTAGKIRCPCHGSEYSTTGSVLNGPATAPLDRYTVTKSGNILTITA
ncbi:MAG TPA: Rieske (2Fe-2S) protein [Bacteroidales bacterium]|nr:Rieske (2Fe-2S) protein [Bacteroidales bacterium]